MKILFVTVVPPWPPMGGASIRTYNFIRNLGARHQVHLACYASVRQEIQTREALGPLCHGIHAVPAPMPPSQWQRGLAALTSPLPDLALRYAHSSLCQLVQQLLATQDFDLVHIMGLEAASAVISLGPAEPGAKEAPGPFAALRGTEGADTRPRVILDELNAEYLLQERAFRVGVQDSDQWPSALYSWVQGRKLRSYERELCATVTGVAAVSEEDRAALESLLPGLCVEVIPNGVDAQRYQPAPPQEPVASCLPGVAPEAPVLLFTGTMDFRPNADAVTRFVKEVLPRIRREVPEAHFAIVGRNPPPALQRLSGRHVTVTGTVADDLPYFHRAAVFVLPMRFGGGSRLKLLQAMACGLPVVTTAMGASGIPFLHEEQGLVAETPVDFAEGVVRVLRDQALAQRLGAQARELSLRYDWQDLALLLEAFYQTVAALPATF